MKGLKIKYIVQSMSELATQEMKWTFAKHTAESTTCQAICILRKNIIYNVIVVKPCVFDK